MSDRKQQLKDIMEDKKEAGEDTSAEEAELFQIQEMEEDMGRSDGSPRTGEQRAERQQGLKDLEEKSEKFTIDEQEKLREETPKTKRSMGSPITGEKLKTVGGGISRGAGIAVKGIKFKGVF